MYFGKKHIATYFVKRVVDFSCEHCSYKGEAEVTGIGQGSGNSPFLMDEEGAGSRAKTRANKTANKNINETIKIAKCPKCKLRSNSSVNKFWVMQVFKIVASVIFIGLLGQLVYFLSKDNAVYVIFGITAVIMIPFLYFIDIRWRWETVDSRVKFLDNKKKSANE